LIAVEREIVILGGPNGAGKTTAAHAFLPKFLHLHDFLNADEIARQIAPENPEKAAFAAGRELLERMRRLIEENRSFAFETTCSGRTYVPILRGCRDRGWRITLYYLWLPNPEDSVARVATRVSQGGHGIPKDVIFRRYRVGLWNALNLYLPLANQAEVYDNSDRQRTLVAQKNESSGLVIKDAGRWAHMMEVAG
jgi:predicted ABC-type ATPase